MTQALNAVVVAEQKLTVHELFERQVTATPDTIAVSLEGERLTYGELNAHANRLAHRLRSLGVGPETCVGILFERSVEMIVAILGVLKAGGCYLPLDPAYPLERLSFMLEDARAPLLLTGKTTSALMPESRARMVCLDCEETSTESAENLACVVAAENLAYVIYTSGSTGQPKGVAITHAQVTRLFESTRNWFGFDARDVWTLFHSYAFDFSVWELWGALLYGGRVVIVPLGVSRYPSAFHELLRRERVTVLNQTPSAFWQLSKADEDLPETELALRLVIFGGEALELQRLRGWLERHGDERPRLVNMYGMTETTVHVTYRPITLDDLNAERGSVIGRAIPDLQVYVLDADLHPVADGLEGEIYVGGAGLACGYLNRPELTAERFGPDSFGGKPGARLYRTGDLARRMRGGDLEYRGRADDQVKVRGFRIEPGEVNAALAQHPAIRESVVLPREDSHGETRLVAYSVCDGLARPASGELREFLKDKLPEHMIPSGFVFLEALPLTPNGKIDRELLPEPELEDGVFVAPSSKIEQALAEVWAETLGVRRVGIDDNYFVLGGDSIRSIQVRAGVLEKGLDFSLQQLFQNPTIRRLAEYVSVVENQSRTTSRQQPFALISEEDRRKLPATVKDAYPLSRLQAGMVFHSEYSPDYIVYVTSLHLRLPLDVEMLQSALDQMVSRHEMLRTSFALNGFSEPLQLVHQTTHLPLHLEDLRHLSVAEQRSWIAEWITTETRKKFDWTTAPLLRFHLHLLGDDSVQFTMSEPFFDGWSVASFCTELFERYSALLNGMPISTAPLSASYRDFVLLERETLQSEQCRNYWTRRLTGVTASRFSRRPFTQTAGAQEVMRIDVPISTTVSDGLKRLAQSIEVSLKSVLLAAHMKVLSLLTGQSDVLTGLLINGRPEKADGERILGAFLNTVPLRMELSGDTWADLARIAAEAENELLPFRRYPIQELQRVHGAEQLFDTVFNYTHFHVTDRLRGVDGLEVLEVDGTEQTYYALTAQFNMDHLSSRIELALDCRTIEVSEEQATEIAGYYSRVLAAMSAEPAARHEAVCLLSEEEQQLLLVDLNDTRASFAEEKCIHQLFEEQVKRAPNAVAVRTGQEELSYRELNLRANRLARHLQGIGVGPDVLVGIFMERWLETLVGLLAVLKAGGAYLPLDPEYPPERISFMIENSKARVVLTHSSLLSRLPDTGTRALCLDADWPIISREKGEDLHDRAMPDNLAYVIYTSGSTGRPKGVLITHRGVTNMIEASLELFAVTSSSRILQMAPLSFDASVLEIFMALAAGATLHLVNRDAVASGPELAQVLRDHAITTIAITPSLLDTITGEEYPALQSIIVGGEACSAETAARWSRGRRLFNAYAPTEATVYATAMQCAEAACRTPPLGRPISNMQVYVLDSRLRPVPTGITGEIHIGGVGLARGYLNEPRLTAERFVPDPFSRTPGARLYKTGDLARFFARGEIEFVGRTDQQVKVRGFRIELGEIETVLVQHTGVREAVVVVREDTSGGKRLVAYLVARVEPPPTTSELREYLKERLPNYMLPSSFIVLDALPLTDTGKVDRNLLPVPEQVRPELAQIYLAPRTSLEEVLCGLFSEVLRIEPVGIRDSFFDLGGHSLLATQVVSRLRMDFQIELPLRTLFEAPTAERLAKAMLEGGRERERVERTAELLLKLSTLSDEEAEKLIAEPQSHPQVTQKNIL